MNHFSDHQWIDFLRGVAEPGAAAAMQQHVDDGCAPCLETYTAWRRFGKTPSGPWWAATRSATLVFDTLARPLPAGVRGAAADPRHLLYEAPPFTIDLHVE